VTIEEMATYQEVYQKDGKEMITYQEVNQEDEGNDYL